MQSPSTRREHDVKSDRPEEQKRSPRKSPQKLKEVDHPMLEMLSLNLKQSRNEKN